MAKKTASKKVSKKAVAIPYKEKPTATLVSFSVSAVIPIQQFGDFRPTITVTAKSIEDARAVVMPIMEDMWRVYAETPRDGRPSPRFLASITETVKVVAKTDTIEQDQAAKTHQPDALNKAAIEAQQTAPTEAPAVKSEAVQKAEKAITLAATEEATHAIQDQIQKSVKIDASDKPALYELVLKRRKDLAKDL